MKLLILMLLSFNSYADVRVDAINNLTGRIFGDKFKTQVEADFWIAERIERSSWGKPKRWVLKEAQTNCLQEKDIMEAIPDSRIPYPTAIPEGYEHPSVLVLDHVECELDKEYTITQVDITAEVVAEKVKQDAKQALRVRLNGGENLSNEELNSLLRN